MKESRPSAARYAISAVFFVFGADVGAWIPHIPDVKSALHLSQTVLGGALVSSGIGAITVMPLTGYLVHRFGSRHVSLVAGIAATTLIPWLVQERSLYGLVVNLFVLGLCYGCLDVAMNSHSVAVQGRHDRPILSSVHAFFSIGGFVGSGGAALADKLGLSSFTHLSLNSAALIALLLFTAPYLLPADVDKGSEGPKFVLPHGVLLTQGLLCLCAFVCEGGMLDWIALYLRASLAATATLGAVGAGLLNFALAVGRLGGDPVVHTLGYRRVLVLSGLITAVAVLVAVSLRQPYLSIAAFSVAALGLANVVPILFAAAGTVPGVPAGTGLAAVSTCGYAGFLLGPPIIGAVADRSSLAISLSMLSGAALLTALLGPAALKHADRLPAAGGPVIEPRSEEASGSSDRV